jgi:sporulation protein YlmC with PRC-barrel domain
MRPAAIASIPTRPLISADRVAGTDVYDAMGKHIGEVHDVMIDKISGQVAYAILSFGGFLGLGERYYPVPWTLLSYDLKLGGYVAPVDRDKLGDAPSFNAEGQLELDNAENGRWIHDYYGTMPYWFM